MNIGYLKVERRVEPRRASVLRKLGIANLVNTAMFDIEAAHEGVLAEPADPSRKEVNALNEKLQTSWDVPE